ncbi:Methyl-accepting chemotaxis protein (MCP) signaling domain protein [anaerobic digester metagenome]
MKLKDLKTGTKLGLSFGSIITMLLTVAFVGIWGINLYHQYARNTQYIDWAENSFINARLNARTLAHLKEEADYTKAKANLDSSIYNVNNLIKSLTSDESKKHAAELKEAITNYSSELDNFYAYIKKETELALENKKLGEKLMQSMNQNDVSNSNTFNNLINARLQFLAYQIYKDPKAKESATEYITAIISQEKGIISEQASEYNDRLNKYDEIITLSKQSEEEQRKLGRTIMDECNQQTSAISNDREQTKKLVTTSIIVFAILSILLGIIVSRIVTVYFTRAIGRNVELATQYANGDLTVQFSTDELSKKDELGDLARAMANMGEKIKEVITSVLNGANNVAAASNQMSSVSQQISQGTTEQASSTEEVSSSMEEMTSNIEQNTQNAQQAEAIAAKADEGINQVATSAMGSLESVREITQKISIIGEIAFQTNILALNAAVEAARAGEHGRGFAVVAAEVRKLAERSRVAAVDIESLSKSSLKVTEEAGAFMENIIPDIKKTTQLVREIAAASLEQRSGADQINNAIQQLNQVVQENAAASEEMATSAEELASQADQLRDTIGYFKVDAQALKQTYQSKARFATNDYAHKTSNATPKKNVAKQGKGVNLDFYKGTDNDKDYNRF